MERKGKADYIFMETAKTIIPAALSFVFKPFIDKRIWQKKHPFPFYANYGSTGIGCTINRSILVSATKYPKNRILFNGKDCSFPTVLTALKYLTPETVIINIDSQLPLGWGFGISGASALGALYCANRLLNLKIADNKLAEMAHAAEITQKTGLGTVATLINGGCLVKIQPGLPSLFRKLNLSGRKIYAILIGPIATKSILESNDKMEKISRQAEIILNRINSLSNITLEKIIDESFIFVRENNLLTAKTLSLIRKIHKLGGRATMNILGEVVLSTISLPLIKLRQEELVITDQTVRLFYD